jgi:hypothetical protein
MKKTIVIAALVVAALAALGVGAVFAQDVTPPYGGRGPMMQGGQGPMHTFMVAEFAKKLNLNVNDVNTRLAAGETMYDIAISSGVEAEDFPVIMQEVRENALDAAVKANVITQEQADWMKSHGFGRGGMGNGNCDGSGTRGGGRGMMGRGWGWQNQQPNP